MTLSDMQALPKAFTHYKLIEAGEFGSPDDRTDERGIVLCRQAGCDGLAVNYSGKCRHHGGLYGPDGMSRLEKFRRGYIGVKDLDYEELREGTTRKSHGAIQRGNVRMPENLYRELVQELYIRHDGQMRGLLDKALDNVEKILDAEFQTTIVEGKTSITSGVSAGDKLRAAQFVWQTVRGKMPENVNVTIDSKPFEKVFEGMARGLTREQSKALREGSIDAEVVELSVPTPVSEVHEPSTSEDDDDPEPVEAERTCPDVPRVPAYDAQDNAQRAARAKAVRARRAGREQRVEDSRTPDEIPKKSWEDYVRDDLVVDEDGRLSERQAE